MLLSRADIGKFYTLFIPANKDVCWLWLGGTVRCGYGQLSTRQGHFYAHRVAYLVEKGPFNFDLNVLHSCDNPPCVNPNHLFLGTVLDNVQDMISKGRTNYCKNEDHGRCKHSNEIVAEARRLYLTGRYTQVEIAEQLGIPRGYISRLLRKEKRR